MGTGWVGMEAMVGRGEDGKAGFVRVRGNGKADFVMLRWYVVKSFDFLIIAD